MNKMKITVNPNNIETCFVSIPLVMAHIGTWTQIACIMEAVVNLFLGDNAMQFRREISNLQVSLSSFWNI